MSTREVLAANLRREVKASGLSQAAVAVSIGLSPASLSRRINGYVPITVEDVAQLAGVLDVDPADLLTLDPERIASA